MPDMFNVMISILISLLLCMAIGYLCRKIHLINDELSVGLSNLLLKVSLPCSIFMSLMREFSPALLRESLIVFVVSVLVNLLGALLATILAKLLKAREDEKTIWQFSLTFANVAYAGFPVIAAVYGADGLIYTSMVGVAFNIMCFTFGIHLFTRHKSAYDAIERKRNLRRLLLNPALISTAIGFVFFVTSLRLPAAIENGISLLGSMTTPIAMLVVGVTLAKSNIRTVFSGTKIYAVVFVRLLVLPIVTLLVLKPFVHNPVMLGVTVLLSGMCVASVTAIFSEQYNGNTELAAKMIFLTTLFSLITIPLITLLL